MKSAAEHLRRCYVRQNGRIFPWGTIRIFNNDVVDDGDEYGGLECWSKELVKFGDGNYYAETNMVLPDTLVIFNKNTRKEVATIPFKKIFCADVHIVKVMPGGFLNSIGKVGMMFDNEFDGFFPFPTESLRKALRGERPDRLDNSVFTKVDASFAGQTLVEITVGTVSVNAKYHIYTQDGKPVKSKSKKWLCWAKWDPKNDPLKRSSFHSRPLFGLLGDLDFFLSSFD